MEGSDVSVQISRPLLAPCVHLTANQVKETEVRCPTVTLVFDERTNKVVQTKS